MKGRIDRGRGTGAEITRLLHSAAVRQPGQPGDSSPDDGRGDLAGHRWPGRHLRGRRGNGRHNHRDGPRLQGAQRCDRVVAVEPDESPVLSGGAGACTDPGHRRRLCARGAHPPRWTRSAFAVPSATRPSPSPASWRGPSAGHRPASQCRAAADARPRLENQGRLHRHRPLRHRRAVPLHAARQRPAQPAARAARRRLSMTERTNAGL